MTSPNFEDAERELRRVEEIERTKMQDRTRAIVEAAERLAVDFELHLDDSASIGFRSTSDPRWLPPERAAALLALARALALPAEPAIDTFPPEVTTREQAQRMIDARRWTCLAPDDIPVETRQVLESDRRTRVEGVYADGSVMCLGFILQPAPEWTSRPPTEPGWYFARWGGAPAGVVRVARGYDESDPTLHLWTMGEELCEPLSEVEGVEWWPMPIQPPPET